MGSLHNADGGARQKHNAEGGSEAKKFKNHCLKSKVRVTWSLSTPCFLCTLGSLYTWRFLAALLMDISHTTLAQEQSC